MIRSVVNAHVIITKTVIIMHGIAIMYQYNSQCFINIKKWNQYQKTETQYNIIWLTSINSPLFPIIWPTMTDWCPSHCFGMQHDNAPDTTRKYTRNSCFTIASRFPSEISSRHQFKYTMYFLISEWLKVKNILIYTWFTCKQYIDWYAYCKMLERSRSKMSFKKKG